MTVLVGYDVLYKRLFGHPAVMWELIEGFLL